jgi:putative RecB family exonuclease
VPYPLPPTLSPSRVAAFCDCALAYRFANLDRLPEPASAPATKGTLVHAALEALFGLEPAARTPEAAAALLDAAAVAMAGDPELEGLELDAEAMAAFVADAHRLLRGYFAMEDPRAIHAIGLELRLRAEVGGVQLTGIIDRLDRQPDGGLVVVDYKTGRVPSERFEQGKLLGVDTYALLCERVLGVRPVAVRLLYVGEGIAITCTPSDRSTRFIEQKVTAVWQTIQRANARDNFGPRPGKLCDWCAFRAWCPAWGGDPEEARRYGDELRAARRADATDDVPLPFPIVAATGAAAG